MKSTHRRPHGHGQHHKARSAAPPPPPRSSSAPPPSADDEAAQAGEPKCAGVRAQHRERVNRWPTLFDLVAPEPLAVGIDCAIDAALGAMRLR